MILVPEIDTVVILTPRCASGALRDALLATYPKAMMPYRHMEADGVPLGYDRWRRVGVVRNPLERLWSLFKFLHAIVGRQPDHDGKGKWEPAYLASLERSLRGRDFSSWITENETVFTSPYDWAGRGRFWPTFTVRHPLPENRKSQFIYLRPDLGTEVWRFDDVEGLADSLGVTLGDHNPSKSVTQLSHRTSEAPAPAIDQQAWAHVERFFEWDFGAC